MKKVNELYSKSVIHQSTGDRIGSVSDVVLDSEVRHVVALVVNDGNSHVVRWNAIMGIGEMIVVSGELPLRTVADDDEVSELLKRANRITGTTIVSDGGEKIGTVGDLFIDESGEIVGYSVSQGLFKDMRGRKFLPVQDVHAVGKDAVIATASSELALNKEKEREDSEPPALEGQPSPVLEDHQSHADDHSRTFDTSESVSLDEPNLVTPPERRDHANES